MIMILESSYRIKGIKEMNIIVYISYFVFCRYFIYFILYIEKFYVKFILRICIV